MENLTVTIVAGAYDSQNGLYLRGYANYKELYKGTLEALGVTNATELEAEVVKMINGESNMSNYDYDEFTFNLLEVVNVPTEMKDVEYLLYDAYEVIDGLETVATRLERRVGFTALNMALDESRSFNLGDKDDLIEIEDNDMWDANTCVLTDNTSSICIKNIRNITQQQAAIFRLANSL